MKNERKDLGEQSVRISSDHIMQSIGEDNEVEFASILQSKKNIKEAIDIVLKTRLSTFCNIRKLTLWYLLSMDGELTVMPKIEDVDELFEYLIEGWNEKTIVETRQHLVDTASNPSHFWLLALKQFWSDDIVKDLFKIFRRSKSTLPVFHKIISDYHSIHKPYITIKDGETLVVIPSKWFRAVIYPFFGGEPAGIFDDLPMSYEDSLRDVFSNYQ